MKPFMDIFPKASIIHIIQLSDIPKQIKIEHVEDIWYCLLQIQEDFSWKVQHFDCSQKFIASDKGQSLTSMSMLILGLRPANERRRYFVTPSLIGWAQT